MFASITSATTTGVLGQPIRVEVHTSSGFPGFTVVGMPDVAMKESKERVRAAMSSSGLKWPESRITINLAPATIRKTGTGCELATLVGLLVCSKILEAKRFEKVGVIGELGLDGTIREVPGTIARVLALRDSGIEEVFVPSTNAYEASLVSGIKIFPIESVRGLIGCLTTGESWPVIEKPIVNFDKYVGEKLIEDDFSQIIGQPLGCEAMMLLAAGGHHTLLMGSPGIGKTMLAERLPGILTPLMEEESHEITAIKSILDGAVYEIISTRSFRRPHHSATLTSLIGGGSSSVSAGEVTRAHKGILFLDELGEFSSHALDALRQPLEQGKVNITRANFHASLPAQFTLLACSNPCPCARERDKCICTDNARAKYMKRLSGPLLDRFDIRLELYKSKYATEPTHNNAQMREKIYSAFQRQIVRNEKVGVLNNASLSSPMLKAICPLNSAAEKLFTERVIKREFSARGATAIWRLARTMADLSDKENIEDEHVSRAFDFREEIG
jgi:magnesium chelatase family protein